MFKKLNENKMIIEAREQGKIYSPFKLLLIYFVIILVINFTLQILFTPVSLAVLFSDKDILKLIMSNTADSTEIFNKVLELLNNMPEWVEILVLFFSAVMLAASVIYCKFIEKRSMSSMGFRKRGAAGEYLVGFVAGFVMMAAVAAMCLLSNSATYAGFSKAALPAVILYLFGYMVQGMAEETFIHGFFMVSCAKNTTLVYSLLMSSILFSLLHMNNNGISLLGLVNIFLFALVAGIYMLRRGSIWGIGALHASWNFAQGALFGFNVSGTESSTSLFHINIAESMNKLNGGSFGPEGGLFVTLILFIALGVVLVLKPNSHEFVAYEKKSEQSVSDK